MANSRKSPAHGDRGGGPARVYKNDFVTARSVRPVLDYKSLRCGSCGAEVGQPCTYLGGRPTSTSTKIGDPIHGYHPTRKRMVIRARNEAIARGEVEVIRERPTPAATARPRAATLRGQGRCEVCEHDVPVVLAQVSVSERKVFAGRTSVVSEHTPEGMNYSVRRGDVRCPGSGLMPRTDP